jgi:hypothetical protein
MEVAFAAGLSIQKALNEGNSSPLASPVLIESPRAERPYSSPFATARK